jgi:TM2 domain-containing membrane protein YozV
MEEPMALTAEEKRKIFEEEKLRKAMQGKSVVVSVILSFLIPGLGDLYCGSWIKALIFFALDFLSFILLFVMGIGTFLFALVWVCGLISAWLSASKSEKRKFNAVGKSLE